MNTNAWLTGIPPTAASAASISRSLSGALTRDAHLLGRQPGDVPGPRTQVPTPSQGRPPQGHVAGVGREKSGRGLTPLEAVAVTPGAWDDRAARQRQAERLGEIEAVVLRVMRGLEAAMRRTPRDEVAEAVREWAGPLARYLAVQLSRRRGQTVLTILVTHPAVAMELRGRLSELERWVTGYGVEAAVLRVNGGDR